MLLDLDINDVCRYKLKECEKEHMRYMRLKERMKSNDAIS